MLCSVVEIYQSNEVLVKFIVSQRTAFYKRLDPLQYWYCNLSLTDTSVAVILQVFRILASGFTYSVHPRLRVFHETPAMQVANSQHATTTEHSSPWPRERRSSVVAYPECQGSVVAFFIVAFNSSGITIVAHILEVISKCEERMRSMQKVPKFSNGRRMVRADGDHL